MRIVVLCSTGDQDLYYYTRGMISFVNSVWSLSLTRPMLKVSD